MTSTKKRSRIIWLVILAVMILALLLALLYPLVSYHRNIQVYQLDQEAFSIEKRRMQEINRNAKDYQVFRELPDGLDGSIDDYVNVFYYVNLHSNSPTTLDECELMIKSVDQSENRFYFAPHTEKAFSMSPFGFQKIHTHILVDRRGLDDEALNALIRETSVQVHCVTSSGEISDYDCGTFRNAKVTYTTY